MISFTSRLEQPRADRAGTHRPSRHVVARIPDHAPDAPLCHPLLGSSCSDNFHPDDEKAAKKAGIQSLVLANFHYTDKIKAVSIQYKAA